jgi:hypothetical protein
MVFLFNKIRSGVSFSENENIKDAISFVNIKENEYKLYQFENHKNLIKNNQSLKHKNFEMKLNFFSTFSGFVSYKYEVEKEFLKNKEIIFLTLNTEFFNNISEIKHSKNVNDSIFKKNINIENVIKNNNFTYCDKSISLIFIINPILFWCAFGISIFFLFLIYFLMNKQPMKSR